MGFLAWATVPSLKRNYFFAWARNFLPTVQRAYLLLETILAWANYAKNIGYQTIYEVFTTTELLHLSEMTNLTRN